LFLKEGERERRERERREREGREEGWRYIQFILQKINFCKVEPKILKNIQIGSQSLYKFVNKNMQYC